MNDNGKRYKDFERVFFDGGGVVPETASWSTPAFWDVLRGLLERPSYVAVPSTTVYVDDFKVWRILRGTDLVADHGKLFYTTRMGESDWHNLFDAELDRVPAFEIQPLTEGSVKLTRSTDKQDAGRFVSDKSYRLRVEVSAANASEPMAKLKLGQATVSVHSLTLSVAAYGKDL